MARDFTGGSSDKIDLGTGSVAPASTTKLTLGCWIYLDSVNSARDDRYIARATGTAGANHYWMLGHQHNSAAGPIIRARIKFATVGTITFLPSDIAANYVPTGQWTFIAVVYDGVTVKLYIDGVGKSNASQTNALDTTTGINTFIGNSHSAGTEAPEGGIAHTFCIFDALTVDELLAISRGAHPFRFRRPDEFEWYLPLDGVFSPEHDYSPSGFDGTISGTVAKRIDGPPIEPWGHNTFTAALGTVPLIQTASGETIIIANATISDVGATVKTNEALLLANAVISYVGRVLAIGETIAIVNAIATYVGRALTVNAATAIQIPNAVISSIGSTLTVNAKETIVIVNATVSYVGRAVTFLLDTIIVVANATISYTGRAVTARLDEIITINNATITYLGSTLSVISGGVIVGKAKDLWHKTYKLAHWW